jgi:hypothetical protein
LIVVELIGKLIVLIVCLFWCFGARAKIAHFFLHLRGCHP